MKTNSKQNIESFHFPIGRLFIGEMDGKINYISTCEIHIYNEKEKNEKNQLILQCKSQLDEFFLRKRRYFDLPFEIKGTEFQKDVFKAICEIPYGQTLSYKDVAIMSGHPNAQRAVGNALHINDMLILIPCHRVITSSGKIGGFGRSGIEMKKQLLKIESEL